MTGTSARNTYGIFKTKRAKQLAIKYNLDLNTTEAYKTDGIVKFIDVVFIVNNLWLDHFIFKIQPPIKLDIKSYNNMYEYIYFKYTHVFEYYNITFFSLPESSFA